MISKLADRSWLALVATLLLVTVACGDGAPAGATLDEQTTDSPELVVYTSVTQDTVDAVVAGFEERNPDVDVTVFRAPTGELTARIAAEAREGGIGADILWMTDPLSIQQYDADGLLRAWSPTGVDSIAAEYRTETYFGTRILNLVIVAGSDLTDPPSDWIDLSTVAGIVAIPDPAFAGSAFGALGYFASTPAYGIEFYRALSDNGALQVRSPGDVVNGVAEGLYSAGISLDRTVKAAVKDGSPVQLIWPTSGAIAIYSPIAVLEASSASAAQPFVEFVFSREAQQAIADTGWQPIRADVEWPTFGAQVGIDWTDAFVGQDGLLSEYQAVFGP